MKKEEKNILKEKFIVDYCKQKGWNHNELTTGQMLIIVNKPDYRNPTISKK